MPEWFNVLLQNGVLGVAVIALGYVCVGLYRKVEQQGREMIDLAKAQAVASEKTTQALSDTRETLEKALEQMAGYRALIEKSRPRRGL